MNLITHRLTPGHKSLAFGVYLKSVTHDGPLVQTVFSPPRFEIPRLPLKRFRREPAISKFVWNFTATHTSIPAFFNRHGFGPPVRFTAPSPWTWVGHLVSGTTTYFIRPFQTRFRYGSGFSTVGLHVIMTRRFILQEARRHPLTGFDSL